MGVTRNRKGILYYDSKYGSTLQISQWIVEEIKSSTVTIERISGDCCRAGSAAFYILGTPIYIGKPMQSMIDFLSENKKILSNKNIFLFITSWAQSTKYYEECESFLDLIKFLLAPLSPISICSLPGKLYLDRVSSQDRKTMERILRRIDNMTAEFQSKKIIFNDQTDEKLSRKFGREINEWITNQSDFL
jgi:menaquinone-dependent protoporphyrinogen IX oxidase